MVSPNPVDRRARRMEDQKAKKRQDIMDAALELFSRQGYEGTTLEDIASELGYAKTSLYYYFDSKESIVRALILESLERSTHRMDQVMRASIDPWDNLSGLIEMYIDDYGDRKSFFNIYHQVSANLDRILTQGEGQEIRFKMEAMTQRIIGLVTCGVLGKDFRQEDPRMLSEMLLGTLQGIMQQMTFGYFAGKEISDVKRIACDILMAGIRNPEKNREPK